MEKIMKKLHYYITVVFVVALFTGAANSSNYERYERDELEFYGVVKKIPKDIFGLWIIGNREVQITENTYFEYDQPKTGSYVEVEGRYVNGTFVARKIESKRR
jgi:hypothetical protein